MTTTHNIDELNISFVGVGGTGVLTAAHLLAEAALLENLNVVIGEIHGMAQRGGSVFCEVRIGENVHGPIIPIGKLDILVGIEPLETLRYSYKLHKKSYVLINTYTIPPPSVSIGKEHYPSLEEIENTLRRFTPLIYKINAAEIAKKTGSLVTMNIVMIGAIAGLRILPIEVNSFIKAIKTYFPEKYHEQNIKAFKLGYENMSENIT